MAERTETVSDTVTSSAVSSFRVDSVPFEVGAVFMTVSGGAIRYTYSNGDQFPSPTFGHRLFDTGSVLFDKPTQIKHFRMIAEGADVDVTYTMQGR